MSTYLKSSYNSIWQKALDNVKSGGFFDSSIYIQWIADSNLFEINDEFATIVVPNLVSQKVFMTDKVIFEDCLSRVIDHPITINVILQKDAVNFKVMNEESKKIILEDKLLDKYSFDNFVVGHSNRESQAAALSCAVNPGIFNPLFIYGNSGLGKTHLLHAIGNYVKKHSPNKKVLYIYSEDFISLIVNSLKEKTIDDVKALIEEADYLLIDDIQRLKQGERSQEIFFNLYNNLYSKGKQIVITSDIHPTELKGIETRLISRFQSGLSVGIDSPEFETSLAILEKKLEERQDDNLIIERSVLEYIATTYSSDVRELEGNLNQLIFKAILYNPKNIDLDFAISAFKDDPKTKNAGELTPIKIKKAVCDFYGLTRAQLESKTKTSNIANARHIAIYLCRKHLDMPFAKIGAEFGGRDHSTIMSSYDKMSKLVKEKEIFETAVKKLEQKLGIE